MKVFHVELNALFDTSSLLLFPDLKENGLFPNSSQTALTPGPPKKKRKINDQPNHNSHHTPKNNKPGPSHIIFSDDSLPKTPKVKKARWHKRESLGSVKPWKPKRPVPTSRDRPPPRKLVVDEADDFPRGGGKGGNKQMNKKRKMKGIPPKPRGEAGDSSRGRLFGTAKGPAWGLPSDQKKKKRKRNRNQKTGQKAAAEKYPTDENLFIIKQRRRRKS